MAQQDFERKEIKYLAPQKTLEAFCGGLCPHLRQDGHGKSTVCNIYYDTADFALIRRSLEKPVYKEKLRLRSYGVPGREDEVFVEIKKKFRGVVYKRRESMPLSRAEAYLAGSAAPRPGSAVLFEIDQMLGRYSLRPSVFLGYDREAYYERTNPSLRITLDRNIRYRTRGLTLAAGDGGVLALPPGMGLMEIKCSGGMPGWLVEALDEARLYPTSFSKYGRVYETLRERSEALCLTAS